MRLASLQERIRELATLPETDAPVISCYVAIAKGRIEDRKTFECQFRSIPNAWKGPCLQDLAQARQRIEAYLASELLPDTKGVAVFSRAGHRALLPSASVPCCSAELGYRRQYAEHLPPRGTERYVPPLCGDDLFRNDGRGFLKSTWDR